MTIDAPTTCIVEPVHDADTFRACGRSIRIQGIEANELGGGCHLPRCPTMDARIARDRLVQLMGGIADERRSIRRHKDPRREKLVLARPVRVTLEITGSANGKRLGAWVTTANGESLNCEAIRYGLAVRWARYDRQNRLGGCRP